VMGIFPTGSNVKRQVSYPSPVSASDRGIFRQNTTKTASLPKNRWGGGSSRGTASCS